MNNIDMEIYQKVDKNYEGLIRTETQKLSAEVEQIKLTVIPERVQEQIEKRIDETMANIKTIESKFREDCQRAFDTEKAKLTVKPQPKTQSEQLNENMSKLLKMKQDEISFSLLNEGQLIELAKVEQDPMRLAHIKSTLLQRATTMGELEAQQLKLNTLSIQGDTPTARIDKLETMLNDILRDEQICGVPLSLQLSVASDGGMRNYLLKRLSVQPPKMKGVE